MSAAAERAVPTAARVVVIGGGIVGTSVAYHLARAGVRDVVLLEQGRLAGGTTWHAAGMVGRLRASNAMTRVNRYSAELYASLESETGVATGWKEVGSLMLARTGERVTQLERARAVAEIFGVEVKRIDGAEVAGRWPLLRTDDLAGAVWVPGDGKVEPEGVTAALAEGARRRGVEVIEGVRVDAIERRGRQVTGVRTGRGVIECESVALCCGMWSRQLALGAGACIPLAPVEHHYVVSEPIDGVHDDLPLVRDPDACIYLRPRGDAVVLGAFQRRSRPWPVERVPDDFSFRLLEPDWEQFEPGLREGRWRLPALERCRLERFVNGPESFTPDNEFILGETAEVDGLFVAAGFNSAGIACAGGAGKLLAEWMIAGEPPEDLWSVDVRRFASFQNDAGFLRQRVSETVGLHYLMAWPNRELETGRDLRTSPLYERLKRAGACFGSKAGHERPNWFAPPGVEPSVEPLVEYTFGRQNWHEHAAAEHRAARDGVALFDLSSLGRIAVRGADACAALQHLCANDVDVEPGAMARTGLLNERGGLESDVIVLRRDADRFEVLTGTGRTVRDMHWIRRHIPHGARVDIDDESGSCGVIALVGPRSRELLGRVTHAPLDDDRFPRGTAREIDVGPAMALALRVDAVGEPGWELHVPAPHALATYERLVEAGDESLRARDAGHYALASLRLEAAQPAWGADLTPDETPLEAGLSGTIAWEKPGGFIGRDALERRRAVGVTRRLVSVVLEDPGPVLWGNEPILRDGEVAGRTTSGAYGHTVGASVALGVVGLPRGVGPTLDGDAFTIGRWEVNVAGERCAARVSLRAPREAAATGEARR